MGIKCKDVSRRDRKECGLQWVRLLRLSEADSQRRKGGILTIMTRVRFDIGENE